SRLERAPISCRRSGGRADLASLFGPGLAHPGARQPRAAFDRGGENRPVRDAWRGPVAWGSRALEANRRRECGQGAVARLSSRETSPRNFTALQAPSSRAWRHAAEAFFIAALSDSIGEPDRSRSRQTRGPKQSRLS